MSQSNKDGGPAFPTSVASDSMGGLNYGESGMSLRDYFAAKALQAGLSPQFLADAGTNDEAALFIQNAAALAYRLADAMLAERAK